MSISCFSQLLTVYKYIDVSYRYICLVWIAFGWAISMRWSQSILECICVYEVRKNNVFFLVCKIVAIFAH